MFLQATQQDLCWLTTEFIRTACIRVKGIYDNVDLKQIDSQLFLQQNRFIQEQKRIVILDMCSNGKPYTCPKSKREKCYFMDLEGAVVNEESIGVN